MDTRQGDRGAFVTPGVTPSPEGGTGFNITRNTGGATLKNYTFRDFGVVVRQESASDSVDDVLVENVEATNVTRFWTTTEGQETRNAICRNVRVVGFSRGFARWFAIRGGLIEDCYAEGIQGGAYITGVHLEGQSADVTIRRVEVRDCFDRVTAGYSQGDGFAVEGGQPRIVLEDLRAIGCGDGGYDLKATDMDLRGTLYAEDCSRGFRFHRACRAETATLVVKAMRGRGIWWAGQTSQYPTLPVMRIAKVVAMDPAAGAASLFRFEDGPADITVDALDIHRGWRGKRFQENGGSGGLVKLPNGCRVEQGDGSWVTYPGAPPTGAGGVLL